MDWVYDDGGRGAAGFRGLAGDCVCRAIAIAGQVPYKQVYDQLSEGCRNERNWMGKRRRKGSCREGVRTWRVWFKRYMQGLGFRWVPIMRVGIGCKVHLKAEELPAKGRLVVSLSKHYTAVIDGVIHDNHDPSREGTRCVYGYWIKE